MLTFPDPSPDLVGETQNFNSIQLLEPQNLKNGVLQKNAILSKNIAKNDEKSAFDDEFQKENAEYTENLNKNQNVSCEKNDIGASKIEENLTQINKIFDRNSSAKNSVRTSDLANLKNLQSEISELKTELIDFSGPAQISEGDMLLGELLNFLRRNKYMSLLMMCRQITQINVVGAVAEVELKEKDFDLISSENHLQVLKEFFKSKNLDFKFVKKVNEVNDAQKLNQLLGGKLVIKNENND